MKTQEPVGQLKVGDVMTSNVETIGAGDSIKDAVNVMMDCRLTTVPVVDGDNKCIGILSQSDLTEMFMEEDSELARALDAEFSLQWFSRALDTTSETLVRELMNHNVVTTSSGSSLDDACRKMSERKIHHLPVLDAEDCVVGILSAFDVVEAIAGGRAM